MGTTDDWYGATRGLAPGEVCNLVYASDFDANEIELLELPDDLLQRARVGEELVFKGGNDEEAVLCTSDTTYLVKRVETSNTLLLMRGASGVVNDTVVDGDDEEANEIDTQTPAVKRRRESHNPITPATTPRSAHTTMHFTPNEENQPDLIAHAQAESHLELQKTEPRLEKVWASLSQPPHVFSGTDIDKTADDEWFASFDDGDVGEEGTPDPPTKGLTTDEVIDLARASRFETLELIHQGPCFLDEKTQKWRGLDLDYRSHLLDVLLVTAGANGWSLGSIPGNMMCGALETDGFPKGATQHALANFCVEIDVDSDLYKVDAEKMVVEKANRLLDQSVPQGVSLNGKWRLDAFLEQWKQSLPEELRHAVSEEKLQGLALLEKPASAAGTDTSSLTVLRPLFAKKFPRDPQERFKHLWGVKPKWTLAELKPYLTPTQEMTVEAQLLKFTRVTQPNAKATAGYSKRQR